MSISDNVYEDVYEESDADEPEPCIICLEKFCGK